MADIVASLFGVTPEMYQQRQAQIADEQALQYAKLDPFQQANFAIGRGAMGLAGAFAGALGAQDPQLRMISQRNAIARQIDLNNPESIMKGVQMLTEAGDTVGAMQLADEARKRESLIAQTFQRTAAGQSSLASAMRERTQATPAEILKAARVGELVTALQNPELDAATRANLEAQLASLRPERVQAEATTTEMRNAAALATRKGPPGSPEFIAEYTAQLERLTAKPEPREPTTPELTNARAIALKAGPVGSPEYNAAFIAEYNRLTAPKEPRESKPEIQRLQEYAATLPVGSAERKQVEARIKAMGEPGGTRVEVRNVMPVQEKGVNANKVKLAGEIEVGALNAPDRLTLARNMKTLLPNAFTGIGSDIKLQAAKVAEAFGIRVTGTTESEIIDQILSQMTLGAAGQLKGALSDKDVAFLKQTIGSRGLTRSTLQFVAERIEREALIDTEVNDAVNKWQQQNKSLNDFNFVDARASAAKKVDTDLKRLQELRAKQGRKGV